MLARSLAALLAVASGCGGSDGACEVDSDCGGSNVCARNTECLPAADVRSIRVTWTIRGQPASEAVCAPTPNFYLFFAGTQMGDTFGFSPVPCKAGLFSIDKIPRRFVSVEIGVENGFSDVKAFDANGNAAFDLLL
ncbi:MAG TPA: hypothetical protein VIV40_36660 [Kofleriaceae bacterium]